MKFIRYLLLTLLAVTSIANSARDGNGNYNLPAGNPVQSGTTISSSWANGTLSDVASALTGSISRDGQSPATGNLAMGGYVLKNLGNGTLRNHSVNVGQIQDSSLTLLTSVSGVDTITASLANLTAYANGQLFSFKAVGANTGAVTININGIGAKSVLNNGLALTAGTFQNGRFYQIIYDGTQFNLSGGAGGLSKNGDTGAGAYTFDTTTASGIMPFRVTNSSIFTNLDPYRSSSFSVLSTGLNNNQPIGYLETNVNTTSLGNHSLVIKNVAAPVGGASDFISQGVELLATNLNTGTANALSNGKAKIEIVSGNNSLTNDNRDGQLRLMSRKLDNSGFEPNVEINALSAEGLVSFKGNAIEQDPASGNADHYLRTSNNDWHIQANATSNRFQVRDASNGDVTAWDISANDDGLMSIYQRSDLSIGRLRFGNSSPSKILSVGAGNTYNFAGDTNVSLTTQGGKYVDVTDLQAVSAVDGGSTAITQLASKVRLLLNTGTALATYGVGLPTTPINSQEVCVSGRSTVTALTASSADGGATIFNNVANNLLSGQSACWIYRTTGNAWWRIQ